jgi:hypothetical protein
MKLTPADIELLRQKPNQTKLWVSIYQPRPIFKALINNPTITRGERFIGFDNVSLGSYLDIESGQTMLIGSSDGLRDIGKIRVRSAVPSGVVVSENSNIDWQDNQHLTVLRYWELWPVYPRIISDPSDAENVIFYKDYDVAYSDQNTVLGTFPNAGPHRAGFIDNGQAQIYYTATGSFNPAGATLSYFWTFEGGTPTGSNALTPGYVSYNTPGHYVTRLIISGSNGGVDTTYRNVSIYDRPENGTGTVPLRYEITGFDGSRGEGGYTASIKMYNPVGDIYEGALVVLFADDIYGSTATSLGGNAPNASSIVLVGYILKDSIRWNYADSYVDFDIGSITEVMKKTISFSISVESKANPQYWYELKDLDVRRSIYHFLRWHSTALSVADVQFLGQDYPIQYFDADRESVFDAIDNLMRGTLIGEVVSDRQGKVWCEVSAESTPNATGTFVQSMYLNRRDWMNQPILEERVQDDISFIELGGIAYSGPTTGTFAALIACAPGSAPSFRGTLDRRQGLALESQSQLNTLVGNVFANKNTRYRSIDMELVGNYRNLDIAPQETVQIDILPEDTVRGISLVQLYIPSAMSWQYDAAGLFLYPRTTFSVVKGGIVGETITIPATVEEGGFNTGFKISNLNIPPLPLLTLPPMLGELIARPYAKYKLATVGTDTAPWNETFSITPSTLMHKSSNSGSAFIVSGNSFLILSPGVYDVKAAVTVGMNKDLVNYQDPLEVEVYKARVSLWLEWTSTGGGDVDGGSISEGDTYTVTPDSTDGPGSESGGGNLNIGAQIKLGAGATVTAKCAVVGTTEPTETSLVQFTNGHISIIKVSDE